MVAPRVVVEMVTDCAPTYGPEPGEKTGVTTCSTGMTLIEPFTLRFSVSHCKVGGSAGRLTVAKLPESPAVAASRVKVSPATRGGHSGAKVTVNVPFKTKPEAPVSAIWSLLRRVPDLWIRKATVPE